MALSADFEDEDCGAWEKCDELFAGALSISLSVYGEARSQVKALQDSHVAVLKADRWDTRQQFFKALKGMLRNIKSDIELGLIRNLQKESYGEVLGDMAGLAKAA